MANDPETNTTPHMTIISHADNQHSQAEDILQDIEIAFEGFKLFEPLIVQLITANGNRTVTVPANATNSTDTSDGK